MNKSQKISCFQLAIQDYRPSDFTVQGISFCIIYVSALAVSRDAYKCDIWAHKVAASDPVLFRTSGNVA